MTSYAFLIKYTDFDGSTTEASVENCACPFEAKKDTIEMALMDGWTNPKWWQWWRRNDSKINSVTEILELLNFIVDLKKQLNVTADELKSYIAEHNRNLVKGVTSSDLDEPEYHDYQTVNESFLLINKVY